jgi:hypothetical protein
MGARKPTFLNLVMAKKEIERELPRNRRTVALSNRSESSMQKKRKREKISNNKAAASCSRYTSLLLSLFFFLFTSSFLKQTEEIRLNKMGPSPKAEGEKEKEERKRVGKGGRVGIGKEVLEANASPR